MVAQEVKRENRRFALGAVLLVAAAIFVAAVGGAWPAKAGELVYSSWGSAIKGYDSVAYFKAGKPIKGSGDHSLEWKGATWKFASAENREAFAAMPEKYAPQFGGYCAWAVSQGYTAKIDPDAWHIENGKLYLNYSKSVQTTWAGDILGNIAKGEANWPKIEAKLAK
ncbi:MAG: YHS domain-containing protein [Rhodospirillales bacterium]|jgi:YHS domain-containing protein|nr:YHS domain-containing protein [Rhodospirillales bacterium]